MIELDGVTRWKLGKAGWSKFASACDEEFNRIEMSGEVDEISIIKVFQLFVERNNWKEY